MADDSGFYGEQAGRTAGSLLGLFLSAKAGKKRRAKQEEEDAYTKFLREAQREKTKTELEGLRRLTGAREDVLSPVQEPANLAIFPPEQAQRSDRYEHGLNVLSASLPSQQFENLSRRLGIKTPKQEEEERKAALAQADRQKMEALDKIANTIGARKMSLGEVRNVEAVLRTFNDQTLAGNLRETFKPFYPTEAKPKKPGNYERAVESLQQQGNESPSVEEVADEMKRLFGKGGQENGFDLHELSGALQLRGTKEEPGPYAGASVKDIISASKTGAARIRKQGTPSSRVGELRKAESAPAEPQKSTREWVLGVDPTGFPGFDVARQFYKSAWDEGKISQQEYQKFYEFIKGHYKKP